MVSNGWSTHLRMVPRVGGLMILFGLRHRVITDLYPIGLGSCRIEMIQEGFFLVLLVNLVADHIK